MALIIPRRLRTETLNGNGIFALERHHVTAGEEAYEAFTFRMPDWVAVAAIAGGRFVLVRQHRHGIDGLTIETPGGIIDSGEDPATAALRELREETGFVAEHATSLGFIHPNPALQDNRCHLFLARDAIDSGRLDLDEHESTEPLLFDPAEVRAAIADGRITHALAIVALERALRVISP